MGSPTPDRLLLCGPSEKDKREAEAVQLPWKAVSHCLNGESRGFGWGRKAQAPQAAWQTQGSSSSLMWVPDFFGGQLLSR